MANRHAMLPAVVAGIMLALPAAHRAVAQTSSAAMATPAPATKPARPDRRAAAMERRIADLHAKLGITPAQEPPFGALAEVMRDNSQRMDALVQKREQTAASGSAVEQMQSYSDMAQAHAEDMKRLSTAFATLYEALSPDQKKAADQSFRQFATTRRPMPG